jgi:hypothetical protein
MILPVSSSRLPSSTRTSQDPDFPVNALEIDDVSASDSSSDGDSTDTEVMQK